jgi:tetratricopeptide (TPR) repeat protein
VLKAAARFGFTWVFPPTGRELSAAFVEACTRTDRVLGCGFGDTLSSQIGGRYGEVDESAGCLVVAVMAGRGPAFAEACVEADPDSWDETLIDVDPVQFLVVLSDELHHETAVRARKAGSAVSVWFAQMQGYATLGRLAVIEAALAEVGEQRRAAYATAGAVGRATGLDVAGVVSGLGGRVALAPPKAGEWGLIGRDEELVVLHDQLQRCGSAAVVSVSGLGGLGKTALTLGYLAVYGDRYDLIAWVDAERLELIAGQYRTLVRNHSGVDVAESDAVATALTLLAGSDNWLVVFDNAGDADSLAPFVPSGPGRVLVTTRNDTWSANPERMFRLDRLSRPAVAAWVTRALPGTDETAADELAGRLDGLALAIVQAIAYLAARGESVAGYVARLADKEGQRELYGANKPPGYPNALAATWDLAVEALTDEAPEALELLRYAAYTAPDNLPVALLDGLIADGQVGAQVAALARYGLARRNAGMLSVHRLVQDVARWPLTDDTEAGYVAAWAGHLRRLCPDPEDHANFSWYANLAAHLLALTDAAASLHATATALAEVANEAGISLRLQASYTTAHLLLERALTIKEAVYGPDHPQVAITLGNLGNTYRDLGDTAQAVELLERALTIFEAVYGPDRPQVAITLGNLGNAHRDLGDTAQAVELLERALTIFEAVYGPDHPQVASTLTNLGAAHQQRGDTARAVELYQRALTIDEAVYGPDHPEVASTLTNLGVAHHHLGDTARAVELLERALTIFEAVYGPDHPQVASTLTNLGIAHSSGATPPGPSSCTSGP